ncbi:spermine oxidase-like [Scaptodrosophila lebanonensis]|uniref:Spermine oxidase-like n=1 Tax=Drosophila lebanonensis TaxID=7225 RepID=A0A6J2UB29_DROLE|nr:spermine oxidase-like [Scaptodrosophila lebanonensis]
MSLICDSTLAASGSALSGSQSKTKQTARIVVIGAGAAGIATATRLLEVGFKNVLVLEAENRVGGRVNTISFADNVVDLGAQWCHGEVGNPIYQRVKDLNMLEVTDDAYESFKCVRSNRQVLDDRTANVMKKIAWDSIPERQKELTEFEGSLGTYLTEKFWREMEKSPQVDRTVAREFLDNFKKFESSVEAADNLFEVSGRGHLEYWMCEGELLLNWRDKGFKTFLNHLLCASADSADDLGILNGRVQLNKRIAHINWQGDGELILRCWNGEVLTADHVICTVSLGVLKEQHKQLFSPALPPAKCRAIDGLKLGTVDKFYLEFSKPLLPEDWKGISFLWLDKDLEELRGTELFWLESVFGFYGVSYQPRILQGWTIGEHARYMETLTEEQVLQGLLWLLRKFLEFEVPPPKRFLRTQWYANPNFRGSYSFRSTYTDELRTGAWDLEAPLLDVGGKPRLQFAGEASHKHFYSTVHGAVESGWREAERLNSYYRARTATL